MLSIITTIYSVLKLIYELVLLFKPVLMRVVMDKPVEDRLKAPKEFSNAVREGIGSSPQLKNI